LSALQLSGSYKIMRLLGLCTTEEQKQAYHILSRDERTLALYNALKDYDRQKAQPAPASAPAATREVLPSALEARLQRLEMHAGKHQHDLPTSIMERLSACEKREYAYVHTRSATITLSAESVIIRVEGTAAERAEDYSELKEAAREGLQALLHRRMKPLPDIPTNSTHGGYVTPQPKKSS
jgi:hypothetical protein